MDTPTHIIYKIRTHGYSTWSFGSITLMHFLGKYLVVFLNMQLIMQMFDRDWI
jgi:hypothetical protein